MSPSGELEEASTSTESRAAAVHPGQLRPGGHRLRGDVHGSSRSRSSGSTTTCTTWRSSPRTIVDKAIASNQSMVMWTVGREDRDSDPQRGTELKHEWLGNARRFGWNFLAAFVGRGIREHLGGHAARHARGRPGQRHRAGLLPAARAPAAASRSTRRTRRSNYSKTPQSARYAFTFWAFPRADYVKNLQDYVKWADAYYKQHGFRCNMPLGSYFIRKDRARCSRTRWDGDIISLDPIHAPGEKEQDGVGRRS